MTSEYGHPREAIFNQLRVDMKIGSVLGPTYKQLPGERVWMHSGESDDYPLSKTLTLQQSQWNSRRNYVVLYFFVGPNTPQTDDEWVAERHMGIRFEHAPRILKALHEEPIPDLPRDFTVKDTLDATVEEAERITQVAKKILDRLGTRDAIAALVDQLEQNELHTSRLLGMTVTGQKLLGINIP